MKLDDLMEVWRSQDAAPLQRVDKTLLHLALRADEAKLQKQRRWSRWVLYVFSVGVVLGLAFVLTVMVYHRKATTWDFLVLIVGAAAALISGRAVYVNQRLQTRREQSFGASLRDQLNRNIAQLDNEATSARRTSLLVTVLMGGVAPAAILVAGWRINGKSVSDDGYMLVSLLILCGWAVGSGVWDLHRSVERDILPRKRRLDVLLRELDGE